MKILITGIKSTKKSVKLWNAGIKYLKKGIENIDYRY